MASSRAGSGSPKGSRRKSGSTTIPGTMISATIASPISQACTAGPGSLLRLAALSLTQPASRSLTVSEGLPRANKG
jgi:hypothetical protein